MKNFADTKAKLFSRQAACLALCVLLSAIAIAFSSPARAEINSRLNDNYLNTQFDYAVFLEPQDIPYYLNYEGSKLRPLTRVRVYVKVSPQNIFEAQAAPKMYEEFWYQKAVPVGLRQRSQLKIEENSIGVIVIGKSANLSQQSASVANALVRLLIDLNLHRLQVGAVLVPLENYAIVADQFATFGFQPEEEAEMAGERFSICLRSYPDDKEEFFAYSR